MVFSKNLGMPVGFKGLDFNLVSLKKGEKLEGFGSAPQGKEFLLIEVTVMNNSGNQAILFPDEEIKLNIDSGKVSLHRYSFETNFGPGQDSRGYLLYAIPKGTINVKLVFGKAVGGEIANLYLSEEKKAKK